MSFFDIPLKKTYRTPRDNVITDFFIPLLSKANCYKRAVGFFSSTALLQISKGIDKLVESGGNIQLIVSPRLSEEDVEAISKGYHQRKEIIEQALLRDFYEPQNIYDMERLNLLAHLIAENILDIKVAFTQNNSQIGIFHEKLGILIDNQNNKVAFSGSINETQTAFMLNYEVMDVFYSWGSDDSKERVEEKASAFERMWNNCEDEIVILEFPKVLKEKLQSYKKTNIDNDLLEHDIAHISSDIPTKSEEIKKNVPTIPKGFEFHDYQTQAINKWKENNYTGIFDMATGTGKTYTGLGALFDIYNHCNGNLAVIISCPYQHLVDQWVEDIELFNISPIIGYSSSPQRNWKQRLTDAVRNQKLKVKGSGFFCFICTNATYTSQIVQTQISKIKEKTFIIVDEAHNFGAERLSKLLLGKIEYRLALSATLDRHNDDEGTAKLYSYFGEKCIEYSLERAIDEHKLTPYKYYPKIVTLNDDELEKYRELSFEMSKNLIKGENGKLRLSKFGEILALKRARIVAAANEKIGLLREYILTYKEESFILVYCGATSMLTENSDTSDTDPNDLRQIEVVTNLLGNELGMRVSQFTSKENVEERAILKKQFEKGDALQVLIAIKCLDEGVNIPKIKTAFILASTTNPKEYIQRRGRVLRLAKGKEFAEIYDFITIPRPLDTVSSLTAEEMKRDLSLIRNELNRLEEFARISMNAMEANTVIWNIKEAYNLYEEHTKILNEFEEE